MRDRGRRDGRSRDAVARRRARRSAPAACSVSFAGSPDRIEARLVPEAGFEFDPFRISGLPRRPGVAQLRGVLLAGPAPRACARILAARKPRRRPRRRRVRRRADGLRRVAEADSGGADRGGRASRAGEPAGRAVRAAGLPRVPGRGREGPKYRVVGPAGAARPRRSRRPRRARGSACRRTGRCCSSSAAARARRR